MEQIVNQLSQQLYNQSWLEAAAVLLALAYVWLAARQNIWCWPCALVSTAIYSYVFWEVTLPFHAVLNAYYMVMAIYGWQQWQKKNDNNMKTKSWPVKRHAYAIISLTVVSLLLSVGGSSFFDAEYLYLDAFITVFSVFTTVLTAHKICENWLYWIVIDAVAVYLYMAKGLVLTGLLFVIYSVFAIYGYWQWSKNREAEPIVVNGPK